MICGTFLSGTSVKDNCWSLVGGEIVVLGVTKTGSSGKLIKRMYETVARLARLEKNCQLLCKLSI
jgi:hypothetical protein